MQAKHSPVSSLGTVTEAQVRQPLITAHLAQMGELCHVCACLCWIWCRASPRKIQLRRHRSSCSSLPCRRLYLLQQTFPEFPGISVGLHLSCLLHSWHKAHSNITVKINFCYLKRGKITFPEQDILFRCPTAKHKIFLLALRPYKALCPPCGCLLILQVLSSCKTQPTASTGGIDEFKGLHILALVLRGFKASRVLFCSACISSYYTTTHSHRGWEGGWVAKKQ